METGEGERRGVPGKAILLTGRPYFQTKPLIFEQLLYVKRYFAPGLGVSSNDEFEIAQRLVEVVVNNDIVELAVVAHFVHRRLHAPSDDIRLVLPAVLETLLQLRARRRQQEDPNRFRRSALDATRALPIDIEDHSPVARQ